MTDEIMHDHNLDLIMALAEGSFDDAGRAAAEVKIAACEECGVELATQRLALDALRSAPTPELTELEAVRMRRALRDELGLITPEPAVPTRDRSMRWQRLSVGLSVAAVLLLFVAVVPALNLFDAGDNASVGEDVALAATTAAPATTAASAESAPAPPNAGGATTAQTDTVGSEMAPAEGLLEEQRFAFGESPDLDEIQNAAVRGLAATGDAGKLLGYEGTDLDLTALDDRAALCGTEGLEAFGAGYVAVDLGSAVILGGEVSVIAYVNEDAAEIQIVAHDADSCEIITSTE